MAPELGLVLVLLDTRLTSLGHSLPSLLLQLRQLPM